MDKKTLIPDPRITVKEAAWVFHRLWKALLTVEQLAKNFDLKCRIKKEIK